MCICYMVLHSQRVLDCQGLAKNKVSVEDSFDAWSDSINNWSSDCFLVFSKLSGKLKRSISTFEIQASLEAVRADLKIGTEILWDRWVQT